MKSYSKAKKQLIIIKVTVFATSCLGQQEELLLLFTQQNKLKSCMLIYVQHECIVCLLKIDADRKQTSRFAFVL